MGKALQNYDKNLDSTFQRWVGRRITSDEVAKFAIDNMNRYGTEPRNIIYAMEDINRILKK